MRSDAGGWLAGSLRYCRYIESTESDPPRTVLALLAAGRGERFHGPTHKLNAPITIAGVTRTIAQHALASALATGLTTILVTGAVAPDLGEFVDHPLLVSVANPRWAEGQGSSLAAALDTALELGAEAVVVGLADQPFVVPATWGALSTTAAPIAVATYGGKRRNPVRFERSVWNDLPRHGDQGARLFLALSTGLVQEVPCTGSPIDIDTLEDLQTWQSRSSTSSP